MRLATSLVIVGLLIGAQPVFAVTAQQEKMKTCNADAKTQDLKGDERQAFMKSCLSGKQLTPQQQRMSSCSKNAASQSLSGDARKKFMSECLKNK
jgi:psiF repeat